MQKPNALSRATFLVFSHGLCGQYANGLGQVGLERRKEPLATADAPREMRDELTQVILNREISASQKRLGIRTVVYRGIDCHELLLSSYTATTHSGCQVDFTKALYLVSKQGTIMDYDCI